MQYILRFAALVIVLSSCNSYKTKYPYSLSDFKPELRIHLEKIVENGGMCDSKYDPDQNYTAPEYYIYLFKKTSDTDLQKLINCEHPILRAYAFNILCQKKNSSINQILVNHLDDTAVISYCAGEFGPRITTVSDYFLDQSKRKTTILKSVLIESVITKYPYLIHAATFFLREIDTDEKYYPALKKIIQNKYPWHYNLEEELINELSSYKKNEDTSKIANALKNKWFKKEEYKFQLIENNPVGAYFFAIEKYYNQLLKFDEQKLLQHEFIRDNDFEIIFGQFIDAAASFRSKKSAAVLSAILNKKLYPVSPGDNKEDSRNFHFHYILLNAISKYKCEHYENLLAAIEPKAEVYRKKYALSPMEANIDADLGEDKKTW
jgi:hypothetical protein